jgi:hypothetical protein
MEKTADLLYKAFLQNDLEVASRAGRLIMQRHVASGGNYAAVCSFRWKYL